MAQERDEGDDAMIGSAAAVAALVCCVFILEVVGKSGRLRPSKTFGPVAGTAPALGPTYNHRPATELQ